MARTVGRLTALAVPRIAKPGMHADGGGLYLAVSDAGAKSWIYRFQREGRERQMGLGSLSAVSLAQARQKAAECRSQRADGIDPIQARAAARAATRAVMTFKEAAKAYIEAKQPEWRNARHRQQWPETMEGYVYPVIGALPVATVDTDAVLRVLKPIWSTMPETAKRVRGRIESVLGWAKANSHRTGDNPALWRDHLSHSLPARAKAAPVIHHPAMHYNKMPAFMSALRDQEGTAVRALEFTILTCARTGEVRGAVWDEFDLTVKVWTVPPERMKGGKEHCVPLSERALAILESLPHKSALAFNGRRPGRALAHNAMRVVLARMKFGTITTHGFRSTFRDWAAEATSSPNHVVEMALAHSIGHAVEAAYRRGDLLEKRRALMDAWANYCASVAKADAA